MHDRSELLPIHNLKEHKQISKNQSEFLKLPEENFIKCVQAPRRLSDHRVRAALRPGSSDYPAIKDRRQPFGVLGGTNGPTHNHFTA